MIKEFIKNNLSNVVTTTFILLFLVGFGLLFVDSMRLLGAGMLLSNISVIFAAMMQSSMELNK